MSTYSPETPCTKSVSDSTGFYFHICRRPGRPDGDTYHCRIHHPEDRAARAAKRPPKGWQVRDAQRAHDRAVAEAAERLAEQVSFNLCMGLNAPQYHAIAAAFAAYNVAKAAPLDYGKGD